MSPTLAVRTVFTKYVVFSGRARRAEYWWFALFSFLVSIVANVIDLAIGHRILAYVLGLVFLLPGLAVAVRRLHDTDRSGWWIFLGLIPIIGGIVLLVFVIMDGTPGPNRFGPSPKQLSGPLPGAPIGYPPADGYQPY